MNTGDVLSSIGFKHDGSSVVPNGRMLMFVKPITNFPIELHIVGDISTLTALRRNGAKSIYHHFEMDVSNNILNWRLGVLEEHLRIPIRRIEGIAGDVSEPLRQMGAALGRDLLSVAADDIEQYVKDLLKQF